MTPSKSNQMRSPVMALTMSAVGFAIWVASEAFVSDPMIPTKGDVPTIGFGSTRYEDGRKVQMGDKPITRQRAEQLAKNLNSQEEARFKKSLDGAVLYQEEFDVYMDFVGQFGYTNWYKSSMRRNILAGQYMAACDSLLKYKYSAGFDCSTPGNKRCPGVWTRQQARHARCVAAQSSH